MTDEDSIRTNWENRYRQLIANAVASKDTNAAVLEISALYRSLSQQESLYVDRLLAEWMLSSDESLRSYTIAVIWENNIHSTLPALRKLAERLETHTSVGAPYEWAKVNRLIGYLSDRDDNDV